MSVEIVQQLLQHLPDLQHNRYVQTIISLYDSMQNIIKRIACENFVYYVAVKFQTLNCHAARHPFTTCVLKIMSGNFLNTTVQNATMSYVR